MALTRIEISRRYRERHPEQAAISVAAWAAKHKAERAAYMREWNRKARLANPEKLSERVRRSTLKQRYGITPEDYEGILRRQGGKCAICGSDSPRDKRTRHFHVDHCHETGRIRGLLCSKCNHALGRFGDNVAGVEHVLRYLRGGLNGGASE